MVSKMTKNMCSTPSRYMSKEGSETSSTFQARKLNDMKQEVSAVLILFLLAIFCDVCWEDLVMIEPRSEICRGFGLPCILW